MSRAGASAPQAVQYPQPRVTKVGGVSEFLRVARLADARGQRVMAHSPYFGPGYYATLQLAAALDPFGLFEQLYLRPHAWFGGEPLLPEQGRVAIPQRLGIGFEPDLELLERFAAPDPAGTTSIDEVKAPVRAS